MSSEIDIRRSLIDVNDSVLIVIDIQDMFLEKYEADVGRGLVERVVWLIKVAKLLNVPIVAMGEDLEECESLTLPVLSALPGGTLIHNKKYFGLARHPEILAAIEATTRKTAILVGVETDVCVAQSALGLLANGFEVVVLKDAVTTTPGGDEIGINRMNDAGALISSVKALYYEWLGSVQHSIDVHERCPALWEEELPKGLQL